MTGILCCSFQVAVSANPGDYHSYAAFVIGVVSGCSYVAWSVALRACHVDDISDTITGQLLEFSA